MAWRRICDKPISEPMLTRFTDAYMRRYRGRWFNPSRPRQNGSHLSDDIFKCIFLNENVWISLKISLKFVPNVPINNIPALVLIMAWRRLGDKPLSEPMMVSLPTHICVTGLNELIIGWILLRACFSHLCCKSLQFRYCISMRLWWFIG